MFEPSGARLGRTPLVRDVPEADLTLTLKRKGYRDLRRLVPAGTRGTMVLTLQPSKRKKRKKAGRARELLEYK